MAAESERVYTPRKPLKGMKPIYVRRAALISSSVFLAVNCIAQEQEVTPRWYVGGGISSTRSGDLFANPYSDDVGYVITGGYLFSPTLAVELGYSDAGAPGFTTTVTRACEEFLSCKARVEYDTKALGVSIVGIFPLKKLLPALSSWYLYAKGGAAFWGASNKQVLTELSSGSSTTTHTDTNGISGMFGAGVGGSLNEHVHARLDIELFGTDNELSAVDRSGTLEQVVLKMLWLF